MNAVGLDKAIELYGLIMGKSLSILNTSHSRIYSIMSCQIDCGLRFKYPRFSFPEVSSEEFQSLAQGLKSRGEQEFWMNFIVQYYARDFECIVRIQGAKKGSSPRRNVLVATPFQDPVTLGIHLQDFVRVLRYRLRLNLTDTS